MSWVTAISTADPDDSSRLSVNRACERHLRSVTSMSGASAYQRGSLSVALNCWPIPPSVPVPDGVPHDPLALPMFAGNAGAGDEQVATLTSASTKSLSATTPNL